MTKDLPSWDRLVVWNCIYLILVFHVVIFLVFSQLFIILLGLQTPKQIWRGSGRSWASEICTIASTDNSINMVLWASLLVISTNWVRWAPCWWDFELADQMKTEKQSNNTKKPWNCCFSPPILDSISNMSYPYRIL